MEASWHFARAGEAAEAADLLVASVPELIADGRCGRAADLAAELLGGGQPAEAQGEGGRKPEAGASRGHGASGGTGPPGARDQPGVQGQPSGPG